MLVRNIVSAEIEIPNEPGQWMKFRRLNARRIAECTEKRQMDSMQRMKALGKEGMELIRDAAGSRKDASPSDPVDSYDRDLLLKYGIVAWSYDAPLTELDSKDEGLDAATSAWAAKEILRFNNLLPEEAEKALGN